ncbi:MAG TPA: LLM class flavin-dependent oxidoreductase [Candidatus Saccharimonadales bacterium]|nr:LLM class flavin-dependent oxidoreductase [Candidatus Saccharimonadales bacterium]
MTAQGSSRPLKVGLQLPEIEREVRWPELRAMARTAEDAGFDSLWVGDHLLYRTPEGPRGPWEAWSMLAGLAASTSRIALGPLVAATSFHSPAMLAKKAATVDEISGGRLILGLGAGWNETEYRAYGFPYDHRVSRFEEAFTIVRTLLRHGAIDFDGRWYQARDCELVPRGPRPNGPPLMVGSIGERMLAIAAPHVDAWNAWYAWYGNEPAGLAPLMASVDRAAETAGRPRASIERTAAVLVELEGGRGRIQGENTLRAPALAGTSGLLAEALRDWARAGIAHVQLVVDPITERSIAALAPMLELLDRG